MVEIKKYKKYRTLLDENINYYNMKISSITIINFKLISGFKNGEMIKNIYTDLEHPIMYNDKLGAIYINEEYYQNNQKQVANLIIHIISHTTNNFIDISNPKLITPQLLEEIKNNKFIKEVSFCSFNEKEDFILTKDIYEVFKDSLDKTILTVGVCPELEDIYDKVIGYNFQKYLVGIYNYEQLRKLPYIFIKNKLNNYNIYNLKYLQKGKICINCISLSFVENINNICKRLKELHKDNQIIIKVDDKEIFNKKLKDINIKYDNILVEVDYEKVPLNVYMRCEEILYKLVKPALKLSSFERYVFVYDLTTKFKLYKENEEDKKASRSLYEILENEYIVCVGFSKLLGALLDKLGIENDILSQTVDISYDKNNYQEKDTYENIPVKKSNHCRRIVHIKDPKYGINGIYTSDPTWDNEVNKYYYNHMLITASELVSLKRYNFFNKKDIGYELLTSQSIEEFYQKINFYINRVDTDIDIDDVISMLLERISILDKKFYKEIETSMDINVVNDKLLFNLASYIVSINNNEITGKTISLALEEIYRKVYHLNDKEIENNIRTIINDNIDRQPETHPYLRITDNNKRVLNKFKR